MQITTNTKKGITIFIIAVLILFLFSLSSCSSEPMGNKTPTQSVSASFTDAPTVTGTAYVLFDYTEGQNYNVNLGKILSVVNRDVVNKVSIQPIRDLSFSKHNDIILSAADDSHGSAFIAQAKAKKALEEANLDFMAIQSLLNDKYTGKELPKSAIVNPVADILAKAGDNDYVIVFSDLIENNNSGVNFRKWNATQISEYLNKNITANKTHLIAVTEAFRKQDDKYMRTSITGWQKYCKDNMITFAQTTNL